MTPVSSGTGGDDGVPRTACEIAAAVRSGSTSALAAVEAALARINAHEGEVHAFVSPTPDRARATARAVDAQVGAGGDPGPLAGVPIAIKDNLCTRGLRTTCGSRILGSWEPPYDATAVVRVAGAGAVLVGKTNLDEFAMGSSTEHSAFGPTRNPYDPERVPGGSSGGSAAAVAAGFVPVALGSDTGGSVRQPASLCGLVGVKPTYGRVSRYGLVAFASSLDQIGCLSATVADSALVLDVIAGHDPLDSTSLPTPWEPVSAGLEEGVDGVRVGLVDELLVEGVSESVRSATLAAADVLRRAGAVVEPVSIPALAYGMSAYYLIATAEASSNLARFDGVRYGLRVDGTSAEEMMIRTRTAGFGDEVKRRIMLGTFALSAGYYDAYYGKAQKVRTLIADGFDDAYGRYDVLLGPTSPTTAFRLGEKLDDPLTMYLSDICTVPSNLAGHPAISVPFGADSSGLPVGVQVLAPARAEALMYRVARTIERAAPALRQLSLTFP